MIEYCYNLSSIATDWNVEDHGIWNLMDANSIIHHFQDSSSVKLNTGMYYYRLNGKLFSGTSEELEQEMLMEILRSE